MTPAATARNERSAVADLSTVSRRSAVARRRTAGGDLANSDGAGLAGVPQRLLHRLGVAGGDAAAVDDLRPLDGADDEAGDVVLAVGIEAGHLGGLAAEQRAAVLAAGARQSLDDAHGDVGIETAGRQVIEEEERLRPLHE